jgi:hypothetical protein
VREIQNLKIREIDLLMPSIGRGDVLASVTKELEVVLPKLKDLKH